MYKSDSCKLTIKGLRLAVGLSQKEFSDLFEIPIDVVRSWDCGRRKPPVWVEKMIVEKLNSMITPL